MATTQKVTTVKFHTHQGSEHAEGSTYHADVADVPNLVAQGLVTTEPAVPPPAKSSQPVEPMTTENSGITKPVTTEAPPPKKTAPARARMTAPKKKGKK